MHSNSVKNEHERKFPVIRERSLQVAAESAGIDVAENSCAVLAGDVTYRLRDLIFSSVLFLRCSKRRKLSVEDVNRSLHWRQCPTIPGYSSRETPQFGFVDGAGVFVAEERTARLVDVTFDKTPFFYHGSSYITCNWIAHNGVPTKDNLSSPTKSVGPLREHELKFGDTGYSTLYLPYQLEVLYQCCVRLVVTADLECEGDSRAFYGMVQGLRKSDKIGPVIVPFSRFIEQALSENSGHFGFVWKLLSFLEAIVENPSVSIHCFDCGDSLVASLCDCIVHGVRQHGQVKGIQVRSRCIGLLAKMMHAPGNGFRVNEAMVVKRIRSYLRVPGLSHHRLASILLTYSVFSPFCILRDIFRSALDYLDLLLSLGYRRTPASCSAFADSIGSLKVCLHAVYKQLLGDALEEHFRNAKVQVLSLDACESPSACALLSTFLRVYLDLFGDGILHLLIPFHPSRELSGSCGNAPDSHVPARRVDFYAGVGAFRKQENIRKRVKCDPGERPRRCVNSFRAWLTARRVPQPPWFDFFEFSRSYGRRQKADAISIKFASFETVERHGPDLRGRIAGCPDEIPKKKEIEKKAPRPVVVWPRGVRVGKMPQLLERSACVRPKEFVGMYYFL